MTKLAGITGFTAFDPVYQSSLATTWLSPYHYITGIGAFHNAGVNKGNSAYGGDGTYPNEIWLGTDTRVGHIIYPATPTPTNQVSTLLPSTYYSHLPAHGEPFPMSGFPCWAHLYHTYLADESTNPLSQRWIQPVQFNGANILPPIDASLLPYCKTYLAYGYPLPQIISGGDSGSRLFAGINGTPVLLGTVYGKSYGGQYMGYTDSYGDLFAQIQTAMNNLTTLYGSSYGEVNQTIKTVDLSSFATF